MAREWRAHRPLIVCALLGNHLGRRGKAVVVISATASLAGTNTKFRDVTVPVMLMEPNLMPSMRMTAAAASDHGTVANSCTTEDYGAYPDEHIITYHRRPRVDCVGCTPFPAVEQKRV